jgi:hypothetical protein
MLQAAPDLAPPQAAHAPLAGAVLGWRHGSVEGAQSRLPSGRFDSSGVKRSIERSLARLGPLDRLLLHEVHLPDITDDLLEILGSYRTRGDVAAIGVATGDDVTPAALERGQGLFTVAHVSADVLAPHRRSLQALRSSPPYQGVQLVGHGVLGPAGRTLVRLRARLAADRALAQRWSDAAAGTVFEGADGPARALLSLAARDFPGELLVATTRLPRVASTLAAASGVHVLPAALVASMAGALDTSIEPARLSP